MDDVHLAADERRYREECDEYERLNPGVPRSSAQPRSSRTQASMAVLCHWIQQDVQSIDTWAPSPRLTRPQGQPAGNHWAALSQTGIIGAPTPLTDSMITTHIPAPSCEHLPSVEGAEDHSDVRCAGWKAFQERSQAQKGGKKHRSAAKPVCPPTAEEAFVKEW